MSKIWTHSDLCLRAQRWLSGTRRCDPVFANIASCAEIPDAIGWSSSYRMGGSTVIECKTSLSDFYADQRKYSVWRHKERGWDEYRNSRRGVTPEQATELGYGLIDLPRMGDYRFYFCEPGIITPENLTANAPDHGLCYVTANRVKVIVPAPERTNVNKNGEIRYLRFAILNRKLPYFQPEPLREAVSQ